MQERLLSETALILDQLWKAAELSKDRMKNPGGQTVEPFYTVHMKQRANLDGRTTGEHGEQ